MWLGRCFASLAFTSLSCPSSPSHLDTPHQLPRNKRAEGGRKGGRELGPAELTVSLRLLYDRKHTNVCVQEAPPHICVHKRTRCQVCADVSVRAGQLWPRLVGTFRPKRTRVHLRVLVQIPSKLTLSGESICSGVFALLCCPQQDGCGPACSLKPGHAAMATGVYLHLGVAEVARRGRRLFKCAVSATRVRLCAIPGRLRLQLARGVSPSLPCLHLANANFCQRLCANSTQAGFASAILSAARQASTLAKPRTIRACHRASSSRLARVIWHEKKMQDCTVGTTGNKSERRSVKPGCAANKAPVCLAQRHPVSGDVNAAAAAT